MKGGKRAGAGRKPSVNPYTAQTTVRTTPNQQAALKTLGGSAWVRLQIDAAVETVPRTSTIEVATFILKG